jgi:Fe-S cluster biogenesis protein NfuA
VGLWDIVQRALGLKAPSKVRAFERVIVGSGGQQRLAALPHGTGIEVHTTPRGDLFNVQIRESVLNQSASRLFNELPVACSDEDAHRMKGLTLDHDGHAWLVSIDVAVHAAETPNHDGRHYRTDRILADGHVHLTQITPATPTLIRTLLSRPDVRGVLLRNHTVTVERAADAPWPPIDEAVVEAVRTHLLGCGATVQTAELPADDDPLRAAVREILAEEIAPAIHRDGGDIELIDIVDGIAYVRLVGACRTCPAATLTLKQGVETVLLRAFPDEIHEVRAAEH